MATPIHPLSSLARSRLESVSVATLTTQLFRRGFRTRCINGVGPLRKRSRLVGQARTLRYIPAREDIDTLDTLGDRRNAQRALVEGAEPGEVIVIDALRDTRAGSLGSILALRLQQRGAAGIVTDGAFRDSPAIAELHIPTYAAAANANTNLTIYHPADVDVPIGCGGVMVVPGDTVVGDGEGVVVIPRALTEEIALSAYRQEVRERFITELVGDGASVFDVYPLRAAAEERYREWLRARDPDPLWGEGEPSG